MASRGVNKVIVLGNLGADPDLRYTAGGTAIASLSVATTEQWTDKQSGQKQERTEWHRVKLFGRLAEIAGEYAKKGRQVYIEGSLRTDKYTGKDGVERSSTDIIATDLQLLGGAPNDGAAHGNRAPAQSHGARTESAQRDYGSHSARQPEAAHADRSNGQFDDLDDIPFSPLQPRFYI
jgi:single-strand DNA-binding protein